MKVRTPLARHPSFLIAGIVLFSLSSFIGCSRPASQDAQTGSPEIDVAAAANLTDAFSELGKEFTARTGIRVRYSFGATADLARQIENGAPFDVFAAADVEHLVGLDKQALLATSPNRVFARGRLVLWTPPGSPLQLERIEDLTRLEVERIAIAKPDIAPYGRATIEALKVLKLWPQIESKVIYSQSVAQAKQYAATGNAEVAFLPLALVKPDEGRLIKIDESLHQPIDQAIAVIRDSNQSEAATRFTNFVLSPEGQTILERYGYKRGDK